MTKTSPSKKATPAKKAAKKAPAKKAEIATVDKPAEAKKPAKASKTNSFENEFVKVEVQLGNDCQAHLDVEVSKNVLEDSYTQALKEISKSISIPGFRKGKVPREMIQKNYASHVEDQHHNLFLQKALEHALVLSGLRPLNYKKIKPKIEHLSQNEAKVSFTFETYPVVPSIDLTTIKLSKVEVEDIDQGRIDEVIDVMRTYRAQWEAVADRPVQQDDFVEVDIENVEEGTKIVSQKRVQVAKGKLSSWITKLLLGMKKGESKEGTSKWDADVMPASEKQNFKPTKCKITVLDIFTAELPEVDETFAKAMGVQSVAELRTQVMLRLQTNAQSAAEAKQREELDRQLEHAVSFDLPKTLVEAEIKTKIDIREQELRASNFSEEDISKKAEEIKAEAEESAQRSLKLFFILQKIANDHNIIVPEQELRQMVAERISQLNLPQEFKSNPQFNNHFIQEMRMNCFVELLSDKVKRYLLKKVTYA